MSIHMRKKVPRHKHFQTDVLEAKQVRPLRPPYRGIHDQDVVVDSTLTLDETISRFTRHWETDSDKCVRNGTYASIITDSSATDAKCVKCLKTAPVGVEMLRTEYEEGSRWGGGEYYCIWRIKVPTIGTASNICRIEVNCDRTSWNRDLHSSEFTAGAWKLFSVRAEIREDDTDVSMAVISLYNGQNDYSVDWMGILPVNVPLATQPTDVNPHSGTDTDPHSGTDTNPHSGTSAAYSTEAKSVVEESGTVTTLSFTIPSITGAHKLCLFYKASIGASVERLIFIRCTNCNTNYLVKYAKRGSYAVDECGSLILAENHQGHTFWFTTYDLSGNGVSTYKYIKVTDFGSHTHTMSNPDNHTVTQADNHTVAQPSNHTVTNPPHEH